MASLVPAWGQDCAQALQRMARPDDATMNAMQEALDHGLPSGDGAAPLRAAVDRNAAAIDALAAASASSIEVKVAELPALRTLIALTLIRGSLALVAHDTAGADRDALTVWRVGRQLIERPEVTPRVIGAACILRACNLGLQLPLEAAAPLRAAISAAPLPSLEVMAQREKERYLADAARAAGLDGQLAPHVKTAADAFAATYYADLTHPSSDLQTEFDTMFSRLGTTYGMLDPQRVLSLLPSPPPPPPKLGKDIAAIVLCMTWLDSRLLIRRYAEALRAAHELSR